MKKVILATFFCVSLVSLAQDLEQKISLTGIGSIQLEPNKAQIQFSVLTENENLDKATKANVKIMEKVKSELKDLGIENQNVKTVNYNVGKLEKTEKNQKDIYAVRNSFNVDLENLQIIGKVISTMEKAGVNEVGGIQFSSTEVNDKTKEAMVLAYKDAYRKAEAVANAAGYKVILPVDIAYDYMPMRGAGMMSFVQNSPSTTVYVPNKLDLEVAVRTVFSINNEK
ncbi:SIMPL domain-containing protein [Cetobacterium sp. SF1]|uniref:SIMPL domain-containing protein n=1 Tax=unclassified Cetobacterium TaxID=2630983 RepID=UPI003CE7CE52